MLIATLALAAALNPEPVREMSEEAIRAALAGVGFATEAYELTRDPFVVVMTPFFRVADVGAKARKEYRDVKPSEVPADILAATFSVLVWDAGNDVQHVVLFRDGKPIQPTRKEAVGSARKGQAMEASFPMAELQSGAEIVIVLSQGSEKRVPVTQKFLDGIR